MNEALVAAASLSPGLAPPGLDRAAGVQQTSLQAGLSVAFGSESALVIGDPNHSVLKSLSGKFTNLPNITLAELRPFRY